MTQTLHLLPLQCRLWNRSSANCSAAIREVSGDLEPWRDLQTPPTDLFRRFGLAARDCHSKKSFSQAQKRIYQLPPPSSYLDLAFALALALLFQRTTRTSGRKRRKNRRRRKHVEQPNQRARRGLHIQELCHDLLQILLPLLQEGEEAPCGQEDRVLFPRAGRHW